MSVLVEIRDGPVSPTSRASTRNVGAAGAVLTFLGVVRALEDDQLLTSIVYETYDPMAQRELERLATEAEARFGLLGLLLLHSRGEVPVGQASLFIEIRSAHRRECLDGMDWLINQLKTDVPIWKHPQFIQPKSSPRDIGVNDA